MDTCKRMWTKDELAGMAGGKIYRHNITMKSGTSTTIFFYFSIDTTSKEAFKISSLQSFIEANGFNNNLPIVVIRENTSDSSIAGYGAALKSDFRLYYGTVEATVLFQSDVVKEV